MLRDQNDIMWFSLGTWMKKIETFRYLFGISLVSGTILTMLYTCKDYNGGCLL